MNLTDDEIERIAERVAAKLAPKFAEIFALPKLDAKPKVLTVAEAMQRTGIKSRSAFYRWLRMANVQRCSAGGFLAEQVDHGMRVVAFGKRAKN